MYPNNSYQPDDSLNTSVMKQEVKEPVFSLAEGEVEDAPGNLRKILF